MLVYQRVNWLLQVSVVRVSNIFPGEVGHRLSARKYAKALAAVQVPSYVATWGVVAQCGNPQLCLMVYKAH